VSADPRARLLYGQWTTSDGSIILFDRKYRPAWKRRPDGTVAPADPTQWIEGIVAERWFYTDRVDLPTRRRIVAEIATAWSLHPADTDTAP
jgi:hypothetical protein